MALSFKFACNHDAIVCCHALFSDCAGHVEDALMSKSAVSVVLSLLLLSAGPGVANGAEPRIVHVVLVWLKEPGNAEHRTQVIEATRSFSSIQGVEEIRVGEPLPSRRPTVDDSFDIGLYIVFSSEEALERYLAHPEHKAAQQSVLRPLVEKVVVYDFRDDEN